MECSAMCIMCLQQLEFGLAGRNIDRFALNFVNRGHGSDTAGGRTRSLLCQAIVDLCCTRLITRGLGDCAFLKANRLYKRRWWVVVVVVRGIMAQEANSTHVKINGENEKDEEADVLMMMI